MKLLFINQSLGIGGAETFNKELLFWLQNHGISVKTFVTNKKFQKILEDVDIHSGQIPFVVDFIGNRKGFIKGIFLLPLTLIYYFLLVLSQRNSDIILMSGFIEKILVTPIAKLLKIKVVWIEFAPLKSIFDKFLGLNKLIYKLIVNLPNIIIVPSNNTLTELSEELNLPNSKFTLIPCARNIEVNNYSKIKVEKNLACCVSRLEKGKGQDLLLQAWQKVEKEIPSAKLRIAGEGGFIDTLKHLNSKLNLKNVEFAGFVPDSLTEIAQSKIVVFPTVWKLEGFGLTAVEAMALSRPVVCFEFGPLTEIIDESTGILVKPYDTEALANAIIKLLNSPRLAEKMGKAGRKKYLNKFTFNIVGQKYINLIKKV